MKSLKIWTLAGSVILASASFASDQDAARVCKALNAGLTLANNNLRTETVFFAEYDGFKACENATTEFSDTVETHENFATKRAELYQRFIERARGGTHADFWQKAFERALELMNEPGYFPKPYYEDGELYATPASWAGEIDGEQMIAVGLYDEDGDNVFLFRIGDLKPVLNIISNN